MSTKIKGIYKGFKFISQIFVVKEREMEIGYPTDVKHVAHIGWDGSSGSAPSWMSEFDAGPEFSAASTSYANAKDSSSVDVSTWSSLDFDQPMAQQHVSEMFRDGPPTDIPPVPKKQKRKKKSSSSCRPSRSAKAIATYN